MLSGISGFCRSGRVLVQYPSEFPQNFLYSGRAHLSVGEGTTCIDRTRLHRYLPSDLDRLASKPKDSPPRRSLRKHGQAKQKPASVKKQAEEPFPRIEWDADKYDLIAQMEVKENRLVLFGKQGDENTPGESKIAVYKSIGSKIIPAMYATSPNALGKRVKGKADR
ncbi:hypothetical protein DFH08DRAFT_970335 [Mycena albidolilacea]|uniref:Uncharacterized protein n=1 Tax=Mycena albidolilacea TaxID=1033008 RepID=A0AAD6ZFL8_9AGAR|nr:hypothetical protein DFH08DRAFT_970335 [Mycena albidolilacea]